MEEEEDWQVICEHSLFATRLHQLEEICDEQYKGNAANFIHNYLRPVVELLDTIRSRCEEYYGLKVGKESTPLWSEQFAHIVKFAIHLQAIRTTLHKGDFYIHISSTIPRTLELKYYHIGEICSRTLSMTDSILMCSENWTALLRSEVRDRFVYTSCVIWSSKGFERVLWVNLLKAQFVGNMDLDDSRTSGEKYTVSSKESINMDELSIKPMLILDLNFELLHSQVVYAPGSRDERGGAVIFFDANRKCWENTDLNSEELAKLLMYFYKIPKDSVQRKGCSLVIDAREGKQTRDILECIGEAITILQTQIPGSVHMAFVLTRKDSLMLLFTASKVKENLNFQFQFLSSVEKLSREIDVDQLPLSFGGQMRYNHEDWIKFRTKVEPFMTGCRSAAKHAMNYMQDLSKTDLGSTSIECEKLLVAHTDKSREALADVRLVGLRTEGKQIIERFLEDEQEQSKDYKDTIECLNRLYTQMIRVFDKLHEISDKRAKHLQLCFNVRSFEEESVKFIDWLHKEGYVFLSKHNEIGDSLGHANSMMEEFIKFASVAEVHLSSGEENVLAGKYLTEMDELQIDRDVLRVQLQGLEHELREFSSKFTERRKKLKTCVDFHTLVQEATQWWMSGLQYIAHMSMEEIQTLDGIHRLHNSITDFNEKNPPISETQLAKITDLAHHLGSRQVEQAEQVNSRTLEVQEMLQVKLNQILGAEARFRQAHLDSVMSDGDGDSSGFKDDDLSTEPDEDEYHHEIEYTESLTNAIESSVGAIFSWKDNHKLYDENDAKLAVFDGAMPTKMKERLRHIIDEMINTEHDYVKSLEYILAHYLPAMDEGKLPPTLKGQKNILFGNLERIYDFHKRFFSQEVEAYRHAPLQIGKCFLKWERQFYLYALYNKNKPKSDRLWDDFANNYFRKKMLEMKDKLDLASYLIKPVQRLGKYALLLKDLISCCDTHDPRVMEMKAAHELMKFQLRHGNDLLAMDAIRHSDVNLKEQGCLLRQGDFVVFYGRRKRSRRVFLFEHLLVFTKAKKQKAKGDVFSYKHSIKMVDIGLTENIGDSGLKFEVWYRRWKKGKAGETFVLQAVTDNGKSAWTNDISRILWRQASRNKEYGLTEMTTGISVESTPSSIYLDNNFNHPSSYTRSRTMELSSPRSELPHSTKRLSWLSAGESSGSSGVFDLGSLPEDAHPYSPRDDLKVFFKRAEHDFKYSSLPRKKPSQHSVLSRGETFDTIDIVQIRREQSSTYDSSFIRNNVYRKTLQVEPMKNSRSSSIKSRRNSGGRYSTQPIVLPSSLPFSEGLPMCTNSLPRTHKYKKVSSERPTPPGQCIQEDCDEDTVHIENIRSYSDDKNVTLRKSVTDSKVDYGNELKEKPLLLRRSSTDVNLKASLRRTTFVNHTKEDSGTDMDEETAKPIRKYSFTKAMVDRISVDERESEKRKASRQRSISQGDTTLAYLVTSKESSPPVMKSAVTKRNPFHNLATKISKSLSDL